MGQAEYLGSRLLLTPAKSVQPFGGVRGVSTCISQKDKVQRSNPIAVKGLGSSKWGVRWVRRGRGWPGNGLPKPQCLQLQPLGKLIPVVAGARENTPGLTPARRRLFHQENRTNAPERASSPGARNKWGKHQVNQKTLPASLMDNGHPPIVIACP